MAGVAADGADQRLDLEALQRVVVLDVPADGREAIEALLLCADSIGLAQDEELELGGAHRHVAGGRGALELAPEDRARRDGDRAPRPARRRRRRAPAPCGRARWRGAAWRGRARSARRRSPSPTTRSDSPAPGPSPCRRRAGSRRRACRGRAPRRRRSRACSACRPAARRDRERPSARCRSRRFATRSRSSLSVSMPVRGVA